MKACLSQSSTCAPITPCESCLTAINTFSLAPALFAGDSKAKEVVEKYLAKSEGPLDWRTVQSAYAEGFFGAYAKGLAELESRVREAIQVPGETAANASTPSAPSSPPEKVDPSTSGAPEEGVVQSIPANAEEADKGEKKRKRSSSKVSPVATDDHRGVENGKG